MKATKSVKKAMPAGQSHVMKLYEAMDGQLDLMGCVRLAAELGALNLQGASRIKMLLDPDAKRFHVYDMEAECSALRSFISSVQEKHGRAVPKWLKRLALQEPTELAILGEEVTLEEVGEMCWFLGHKQPAFAVDVWATTVRKWREFVGESA